MGTVYVPQQPARFDTTAQLWVPSVNIKPAERWGEIKIMFEQSVSRAATAPLAAAMREIMKDYGPADCVCAVGDPSLIAIACCIAVRKCNGDLRLLKWDRQAHDYIMVEVRP